MRTFPFIFIPLQIFYSSFPFLYEDSHTLIPWIPTLNSPHYHPDSPHSHHSYPDCLDSHDSPPSVPKFSILAFIDSPEQVYSNKKQQMTK